MNEFILIQYILGFLYLVFTSLLIISVSVQDKHKGKKFTILYASFSIAWCCIYLMELNA